jgi:hypothetical protein
MDLLDILYIHVLKHSLPQSSLRRRNDAVREVSHCYRQTNLSGMLVDSQTPRTQNSYPNAAGRAVTPKTIDHDVVH